MARARQDQRHRRSDSSKSATTTAANASTLDVDFSNNYIHTGIRPISYIENIHNPLEGYPRLQRLRQLKLEQTRCHVTPPFGCRINPGDMLAAINSWIYEYSLQFDVIMIGALVDTPSLYTFLKQLPLHKLCARPGFLFIWATTQRIKDLTVLLNSDSWGKKFRRSEELIFMPLKADSPYYPPTEFNPLSKVPLFERQQWHCWMCITGTVRRSTDGHLIHCNVDTDLQIGNPVYGDRYKVFENNAVPDSMYKLVENFSNSNRRLHIVPFSLGYNMPIRMRPGWVIMLPDSMLDNFDPNAYHNELLRVSQIKSRSSSTGTPYFLVPQTREIEDLRPKSPVNAANKRVDQRVLQY